MSSTSPPSSSWEPPLPEDLQRLLPQYEITDVLGRGGMGAVYKGRQANLDRNVAIKLLPETFTKGEDELNFVARFKQEARAMANLDHPAILSVYDFGETPEGQLYIVMEFIDGMDIHQYLREHGGKLPQESALAITAHVLDALDYAHNHGIVHRDIKPANILLNREGRVKIADFGLAKKFGEHADADAPALTMSNVAVGTPDFVAPEALDDEQTPDHRADLYAVGVMLYQMLTGKLPRGLVRMPSELNPEADPRLDDIVSKAMEPNPDYRYASAVAMRADLDGVLSQPMAKVEAGERSGAVAAVVPVTTSVKGKKGAKEASKLPVYLGVGIAAVAVVGIVVFATRGGKEVSEGEGAQEPVVTVVEEKVAPASPPVASAGKTTELAADAVAPESGVPSTTETGETPVLRPVEETVVLASPPVASAEKTTELAADAVVPESGVPSTTETGAGAPRETPVLLASLPGLQIRLKGYLTARNTQLIELAARYERGIDSQINRAADSGDLALVNVFREEKTLVSDLKKSLAETPVDTIAAVAQSATLPALPDGSPEGLTALRTTWETEKQKIQEDLDAKLSLSLQALEAELTRSRAFEEAEAVLAYRETLSGGQGNDGVSASVPLAAATPSGTGKKNGPYQIFDGKSLDGWRSVPNGTFFRVVDGAIRVEGRPANLFYEGTQVDASEITDFDLTMKVKTEDEANSGIFFHCVRKPDGGYERGPEFQIANENRDPQKTGSLWRMSDPVTRMPARDGEWFEYRMVVSGKTATSYVDGRKLMEWTQPDDWTPPADQPGARMGRGTFAIQANGGIVWIKDVVLKVPATSPATASTGGGDSLLPAATKYAPFENSLGMKFVPVPGTDVLFCIHETRWRDFAAYAKDAEEDVAPNWRGQTIDGFRVKDRHEDHPVASVAWEDAKAFCAWLSKREGKTYRLPTDREWSIAVGVGREEDWKSDTTPETVARPKDIFPWGKDWPPPKGAGNYSDQSRKAQAPRDHMQYSDYDDVYPTTAPVMCFSPNGHGLYDLGGNAWEWVEDWSNNANEQRVLRGGSWFNFSRDSLLSSVRISGTPSVRHYYFGFRVVLVPSPSAP